MKTKTVKFLHVLKMIHDAGLTDEYDAVILVVYLTDVWGLRFTQAAGLINIWVGISKFMPLIFLFLLDNCIGSYWMLVISTTTSALGTGLLFISTPSWLYSRITGSCSEYKMKCIGETQQSLFYVALILTMIGNSARVATMQTLNFKGNVHEQSEMKQFVTSGSNDTRVTQILVQLLVPWSILFGISSISRFIVVYHLMGKSWSHKLCLKKPERSSVTSVLRVFVSSLRKRSLDLPQESVHKTKKDDPCSSSLRFLDKAAIRGPKDKGRRNRWMLCSLQEVEDAKSLLRMLPIGVMIAFLMLIRSICGSYFLQQAKRMKPMTIFGFEVINLSYLPFFYHDTKIISLEEDAQNPRYKNKYINNKMVRSAVVDTVKCAIWCCVIAALVEKSRLNVIRDHGLANKPGEIIPMKIFWLLPQFLILGRFEASLERILHIFLAKDTPLPLNNLKIFVFDSFIGVGVMSSVLVVYLVGKISEIGGRPNWFQHDTENSRLDLFYWTLTMLCVVVTTIWFQVSRYFNKKIVQEPGFFSTGINIFRCWKVSELNVETVGRSGSLSLHYYDNWVTPNHSTKLKFS